MEQDVAATTPVINNKSSNGKGWKIATIITSILAACGIGFGVYGMVQSIQKDGQISDLKVQVEGSKDKTAESEINQMNDNTAIDEIGLTNNLHLIGDLYTKRRYYLGITDLDPNKDSREIDIYLIDTTKLGTKEGVSKYDMKTIIDKIVDEKVASLPDILSPGTQNATQKTNCKSFTARIGDVTENPLLGKDWTTITNWNDLLPMTVYMQCIINDSNVISYSLGTDLYALNPQTGEVTMLKENWQ